MNDDREARVRRRAYQLWQDDGAPQGKADEYWSRAEKQIAAESDADGDGAHIASDQAGKRRIVGGSTRRIAEHPPCCQRNEQRRQDGVNSVHRSHGRRFPRGSQIGGTGRRAW